MTAPRRHSQKFGQANQVIGGQRQGDGSIEMGASPQLHFGDEQIVGSAVLVLRRWLGPHGHVFRVPGLLSEPIAPF